MKTMIETNLESAFNHKLVYSAPPRDTGRAGLDGVYIPEEEYFTSREADVAGIPFRVLLGELDNAACDGQSVAVTCSPRRVYFLGFSFWGDNYEIFRLERADGSSVPLRVLLPDWSHRAEFSNIYYLFNENLSEIKGAKPFICRGARDQVVYLHVCGCDVPSPGPCCRLVFPENLFMHIFAVTCEE